MLIWYQQKYPIGDWKQKNIINNQLFLDQYLLMEWKNNKKKDRKQMNWLEPLVYILKIKNQIKE